MTSANSSRRGIRILTAALTAATAGALVLSGTPALAASPTVADSSDSRATTAKRKAKHARGITAVYTAIYDDSSYQANTRDTPYGRFDIVYLAFAHVDATTNKLDFKVDSPGGKDAARDRMLNVLRRTKRLRAQGKLKAVISLGHGAHNADIPRIEDHVETFARSVRRFVNKWGLDGFDIDYEEPTFESNRSFRQVSRAIRRELGPEKLFTITPNKTEALDGPTLNKFYNYVNVQNYDAEQDAECPITDFTDMPGLSHRKILAGLDIENGDQVERAKEDYRRYRLAGIFAWKLVPNFDSIARQMWRAVKPW